MSTKSYNNGHELVYKNNKWVYADTEVIVSEDTAGRACVKCGQHPNERGDDYCIQNLGKVLNACCGHGNKEGYIQFDNGITIRGFFRIERNGG